jgi:hypothetical protein
MKIEQAIMVAKAADYKSGHGWEDIDEWWTKPAMFSQPEFWKALMRAKYKDITSDSPVWKTMWLDYIRCLMEGKKAEDYFKTL